MPTGMEATKGGEAAADVAEEEEEGLTGTVGRIPAIADLRAAKLVVDEAVKIAGPTAVVREPPTPTFPATAFSSQSATTRCRHFPQSCSKAFIRLCPCAVDAIIIVMCILTKRAAHCRCFSPSFVIQRKPFA